MELKSFFAQDDQGNKLPGATCYVYMRGTEKLAVGLFKANGLPLSNPFTSGDDGHIQLALDNGLYDIRVVSGGRDNRIPLQFNDVAQTVAAAQEAADRASHSANMALTAKEIYPDEQTGRSKRLDGEYFYAENSNSKSRVTLWRRVNNDLSLHISDDPNIEAYQELQRDLFGQRFELNNGGFANFIGPGTKVPIITDAVKRYIFGYDKEKGRLFGSGLLTDKDVLDILALLRCASYTGTGPIFPFHRDTKGRVLLGYDADNDRIIGAGLNSAGTSYPPAPAVPLPFAMRPIVRAVNHMAFYGQSLTTGATALPVLSTTQPYSNLTFKGGTRGNNDLSAFKGLVEDSISPAPDGGTNRGETPCSAAANYASLLAAQRLGVDPSSHVILASTAGHGGYRIDQLTKSAPWYQTIISQVRAAKAINADYAVHVIGWLQGENDALTGVETPYDTYRAALEQIQKDLETDIKAITEQPSAVFMVTYQISYAAATWPAMAKAQLDLVKRNPKFFLATPMYQFPYAADKVHLTNVSNKWVGAYFGRAYQKLVVEGVEVPFLNPVSAIRTGNKLRLRFDVPVPPLVLDVQSLAITTDHGFRVKDSQGAVSINSVSVENGCEVVLSLSVTPVGATTVRYALDYLGAGLTVTGGASGNLRDSECEKVSIAGIDRPLFNLCPHFELPVITDGGI